jgi:RNA polymerase sigma factor (sigma-70 family)
MADGPPRSFVQSVRQLIGTEVAEGAGDACLLGKFVHMGDETAFASLVQRHGPLVNGVCRRLLHQRHDAEDAFQATFLVLARRSATIRNPDALGTWLYAVAYRVAARLRAEGLQRRARERQEAVVLKPDEPLPPCEQRADPPDMLDRCSLEGDPLSQAAQHDLRAVLDSELNRLPAKYRAPLVLCYLEGKTNEEAAQQLHWTKGTVSGRLARARDLLRDRLVRRGLALPAGSFASYCLADTAAAAVAPPLVDATVRAIRVFAVGQTVPAGAVSGRARSLAERMLQAMWLTRVKIVLSAALAACMIGIGALGLASFAREQAPAVEGAGLASPGLTRTARAAVPKFKFVRGTALYLEVVQEIDGTVVPASADPPHRHTSSTQTTLRSTPTKQLPDGSWVLRQQVLGMKVRELIPILSENEVAYDSTDPKASSEELRDIYRPLIGAEWYVTINPQGKITQVDNKQMLNRLFFFRDARIQAEGISGSDLYSPYFRMLLPARTTDTADAWVVRRRLPLQTSFFIEAVGTTAPSVSPGLTFQEKYVLGKRSDDLDEIRMESTFSKDESAAVKSGSMLFNQICDVHGSQRKAFFLFNCEKGRIDKAEETWAFDGKLTQKVIGRQPETGQQRTRHRFTLKITDHNPIRK